MLGDYVPNPRLTEREAVEVDRPPDEVYAFARAMDLGQTRSIRTLFALRTLPARLTGKRVRSLRLQLDDVVEGEAGFRCLSDRPGRGFALGAIGKIWHVDIPFETFAPDEFADFDRPGFGKVAWSLTFEPRPAGGTRVEFELRLDATDDASWHAFHRYYTVIRPFSRFIRRQLLRRVVREFGASAPEPAASRPRDSLRDVGEGLVGAAAMAVDLATPFLRRARSHWGVDREIADRSYPGDDIVATPRWSWTHGIEIAAPPAEVWPWIAQIGQGRAGFYSYQWLENLAGCDIRNAEHVHPEWTHPRIGDGIKLHPRSSPLTVQQVEPDRSLLLDSGAPSPTESGERVRVTWLFHLEPVDDGKRTRLISRFRSTYDGSWKTRLAYGPYVTESIGFVMDRRMLIGVKERAERTARS